MYYENPSEQQRLLYFPKVMIDNYFKETINKKNKITNFPMIPVPTVSVATFFTCSMCFFFTNTISIIPTSRTNETF